LTTDSSRPAAAAHMKSASHMPTPTATRALLLRSATSTTSSLLAGRTTASHTTV
jgi:hypothetical protein